MCAWQQILFVVQRLDTHELPPVLALVLCTKKRSLANEVGLFPGHNASKTDIQRIGHTVRIAANVQIAFFGAEYHQCLGANRYDTIATRIHQCFHNTLAMVCRNTDLEAHFTRKADPLYTRRYAEECACSERHMRQSRRRKIDVGFNLLQNDPGVRTCNRCYGPLACDR